MPPLMTKEPATAYVREGLWDHSVLPPRWWGPTADAAAELDGVHERLQDRGIHVPPFVVTDVCGRLRGHAMSSARPSGDTQLAYHRFVSAVQRNPHSYSPVAAAILVADYLIQRRCEGWPQRLIGAAALPKAMSGLDDSSTLNPPVSHLFGGKDPHFFWLPDEADRTTRKPFEESLGAAALSKVLSNCPGAELADIDWHAIDQYAHGHALHLPPRLARMLLTLYLHRGRREVRETNLAYATPVSIGELVPPQVLAFGPDYVAHLVVEGKIQYLGEKTPEHRRPPVHVVFILPERPSVPAEPRQPWGQDFGSTSRTAAILLWHDLVHYLGPIPKIRVHASFLEDRQPKSDKPLPLLATTSLAKARRLLHDHDLNAPFLTADPAVATLFHRPLNGRSQGPKQTAPESHFPQMAPVPVELELSWYGPQASVPAMRQVFVRFDASRGPLADRAWTVSVGLSLLLERKSCTATGLSGGTRFGLDEKGEFGLTKDTAPYEIQIDQDWFRGHMGKGLQFFRRGFLNMVARTWLGLALDAPTFPGNG